MTPSGAVKRVLYHAGLLTLARLARAHTRALVLRYHAVTRTADPVDYAAPSICLPVEAFRLQMAYVKRAYTVVPQSELIAALERGGKLPPRALCVTFDDGYADNHALAHPVLRDLGLPATVFLTTGTLDGGPPLWMSVVRLLALRAPGPTLALPGIPPVPLGRDRSAAARAINRAMVPLEANDRADRLAAAAAAAGIDPARALADVMLTWAQVREMAAAGWTIGAHTVTHVNVAAAAPAAAEAEIVASRDAVASVAGGRCEHFAYTNTGGEARYFSREIAALLKRHGFRSGVTSVAGNIQPGAEPFLLPRVGIGPRLAPVVDLAAALERQRLAA